MIFLAYTLPLLGRSFGLHHRKCDRTIPVAESSSQMLRIGPFGVNVCEQHASQERRYRLCGLAKSTRPTQCEEKRPCRHVASVLAAAHEESRYRNLAVQISINKRASLRLQVRVITLPGYGDLGSVPAVPAVRLPANHGSSFKTSWRISAEKRAQVRRRPAPNRMAGHSEIGEAQCSIVF